MKYGILLSKNLMASQVFWTINNCGITVGLIGSQLFIALGRFVFFLKWSQIKIYNFLRETCLRTTR